MKNTHKILLTLLLFGAIALVLYFNLDFSTNHYKNTLRNDSRELWDKRQDSASVEIASFSFIGIVDSIYRSDSRNEYDVVINLQKENTVDFSIDYYPYLKTKFIRQQIIIRMPDFNVNQQSEKPGQKPKHKMMVADKIKNEEGSLIFTVFVGNTDSLRYEFELFANWKNSHKGNHGKPRNSTSKS